MSYNNSVLVGNWAEGRLENEFEFKMFLRKRDRRELLLQRSRALFSNLLMEKPMLLSGMYVMYGFHVQVVASDMPAAKPSAPGAAPQRGLALSTLVTERQVDLVQNVADGCLATLSPITTPCCRNTFTILSVRGNPACVIKSTCCSKHPKPSAPGAAPQRGLALSALVTERQVDLVQNVAGGCLATLSPITTPCCRNTFTILSTSNESAYGENVHFGDEFLLRAENSDPTAAPLYLTYTTPGAPAPADRMPICLTAARDSNCRWVAEPLLPKHRSEGFGTPIQTGTRLVIKNCVADQCLCVMNQNWMQTFFGPECGVTCRNVRDIHKRFTAENVFTFVSDVETKKQV
ncbi:unnamed protein product [Plutella xylostella]|uniref:(diamondback moth) hypothetical protein n=1 Tax=Plutella xylostella TaxID=51655 RepID=A0A8S4ENW6_PLUXY|nr:unnamed protein product [Plutella xylostella]